MQRRFHRVFALFLAFFMILATAPASFAAKVNIAVTAGEGGSVSTSALSAEVGDNVAIRAIPDAGFRFDHWQLISGNLDLNEQAAEQTITVEEDIELKAHFRNDVYTVTVELADRDGGSFNFESRDFAPGAEVTVIASPYDGFSFSKWESEDVDLKNAVDPTLKFTMPHQDVVLYAGFDVVTYRFRALSGAGGTVAVDGRSPNSRGEYECVYDEEIEILAEPRENFLFSGWVGTNGASFSDPESASTTLHCPASDFTIRAQFASAIKNLTITSTEGGTVSPQEGTVRVGVDNTVELLAVPDDGYVFSNWECSSVDGKFNNPKKASATFTMPDMDCTVTAVFTKGGYRLTVLAGVGGRVDEKSSGNYPMEEQVSISAVPEEGYEFSRWEATAEDVLWDATSPETVVTMPDEDVKVTAVFVLKGGAAVAVSDLDQKDTPSRSFPLIPLIVVFVLSGIAIALIVIREHFNLSYRYLIRKWFKKVFGQKKDE